MSTELKKLNKKSKSYFIASAVLLGLSFGSVAHASTIQNSADGSNNENSTNTQSISVNNKVASSSEKSVGSGSKSINAISESSSASSQSISTAVSGDSVTSTSLVANSTNATSEQSSATADTNNLGEASDSEFETAKSTANADFEKTGESKTITRVDAVAAPATVKNGWATDSDSNIKYFYQNGSKANGYLNDGTNWYLFKDGIKQSDVQKWAGTYYYFDHSTYLRVDNAYLKSNWGEWYLFGNNGQIKTGVQKWAGTYYFFYNNTYLKAENDYLKSSWDSWYLFGSSGRIVTGLAAWAGTYYYFNSNTFLKSTNTNININGQTYKFGDTGSLIGGIVKNGNSTFYVDQHNGVTETYVSYVTGDNLLAKEWIASHESGGSYTARNGVCYGRYQLNEDYYLHGNNSMVNQEKQAEAYVEGRYGSWINAKKFWLLHHWY